MSFYISGTGSSVPKKVITNFDLMNFLETDDEWISSRTGIRERRVLTDEKLLDLACEAAQNAIFDAHIKADEIDMIICSSLVGDYISPAMSCLIRDKIGSKSKFVFDINMACSGFIYAMDLASVYFDSGRVSKVLIICAESLSRLVDWQDRASCVLFGDGAGAVVLEKGNGLIAVCNKSQANAEILNVPGVRGNNPFSKADDYKSQLTMDGQEVFMFAVSSIIDEINSILENNALSSEDISLFILHQANIRIINTARKKLKQPEIKFPHNIEKYGNTSSASIPILLDELNKEGKLKLNDKLIFCAFGAGLTTGTCIIEWKKKK